jgi:mono/diheme cytochrome c family protein
VLFDSGDAWASAQSINPISNTVDNALSGQAKLSNSAAAIAKDVYNVTPVALLDWVVFDVLGPSGKEFRYDPALADKALKEGRNPFCAQCHGPGGALDPNNAWIQQARLKQLNQSWNTADTEAIIKWLETSPK